MEFAGVIRPVIDRVYVGLRGASHARVRALYEQRGLNPGIEVNCYYALLDHPVPAEAVAAWKTYSGFDTEAELARGIAELVDGVWQLTAPGRQLALAVDEAVGAGAERLWGARPIETMPGLGGLERLSALTARVLEAGQGSGGPAFSGLTPVFAADDAGPAAVLASQLGALRHHRADAHRAAWRAAGLSAGEVVGLGPGPVRDRVEAETDRLDATAYRVLSASERLELLAGLGALPDGISAR
ncbi:hypothetical protein [Glycomyces buryatensis]|uniref:Uncharacterized protein n=1 Tax=Glycomyces buryatensis TaxID=2570927 RepID=A0A4S8PUN2_9ACTN|nr:hypothetical protein [Glycomyces buryatensis]THV33432.1 hypothetical protein FAB82_25125 [Glycomyces buryatensis]